MLPQDCFLLSIIDFVSHRIVVRLKPVGKARSWIRKLCIADRVDTISLKVSQIHSKGDEGGIRGIKFVVTGEERFDATEVTAASLRRL